MHNKILSIKTRFNLADKASLLFSSGILLVVFVCVLLTRYFYIQQIENIEQTQLLGSTQQAKTAINSLVTEQEEYSYDWAHWDETYLLLKENDPSYAERNLSYGGLQTLKLSLMLFVNRDGEVVESAYIPQRSANNETVTAVPDDLVSTLLNSPTLNQLFHANGTDTKTESLSGLLKINNMPWIISITAVTDSLEEQDSNGWMIWGTPLVSKFPSKFKQLLSDEYQIISLAETEAPTAGPGIVRTPLTITDTGWLQGIDGHPVARIKTTAKRVLYQHANQIIQTISLILGVATVITLFIVLYLFRTRIGTSFTRLEEENQTQTGIIDSLARRDLVSGLYNRQSVMVQLYKLLSKPGQHCSLLYISVDRLKPLARIFGHQTIEHIIRHLTQSFTQYAPDSAIIGRVTESDFVIIHQHTPSDQALLTCAENITNLYRRQVIIDDLDIQLAVAVGYLQDASALNDAETILTCGKYTAQISATDQHAITHFSDSVIQQFTQHKQLQKDLASAIKHEVITPYYQPIVDTVSRQAIGFEALARWKHPKQGMVSPGIFIPMAEERNFIIPLGEQILEQSCRFITQLNRERQQNGLPPMTIHVNLSAPHLQHHGLQPYIDDLLQRFALAPHLLTLELTESILIDSVSDVIEQLNQLRKKGIRIAIDDFGTGYSSLSTLNSFPVDTIKLDRNFVLQLEQNEKGYALIKNIVQLAKDMQLNTVVEGVETEQQKQAFTRLNVDNIQGFYFYKPMPLQSALYQFSEPEY